MPVIVCEGANVQDCAVVHALGGTGVKIGPRSSIAHATVIHGPCEIGTDCFVGFNSVIFNSTLGDGVIVMHHVLIEGVTIPPGHCVQSARVVRCEEDVRNLVAATPDEIAFVDKVCQTNMWLAEQALKGCKKG
jgi:carbonic anhydrase/acetyltransferase-like protein (isoleucine patch superfamily)